MNAIKQPSSMKCERCQGRGVISLTARTRAQALCQVCRGVGYVQGMEHPTDEIANRAPRVRAKQLGGTGLLQPHEIADLSRGCRRVWDLMAGGEWYSAPEIRRAAGGGVESSEGLRRLRELRSLDFVQIEKRRIGDSRLFEYRLVVELAA